MPALQPTQGSLKDDQNPNPVKPKVLFSWNPPVRPFKRRGKEFYTSLIAIIALVGFIVFIVEGWLPVVLLISLGFLFYVLSTVEPIKVESQITDQGIMLNQKLTTWNEIIRFWFTRRLDHELLVVETLVLPGRIELVIEAFDKETIEKQMSKYAVFENKPPTYFDRASSWFETKQGR